ncbi:MAG TPA: diaminopropionate ammonia-lyase [Vicinamibacteria bacterium]|jgi:diaminopropionate ammonia-lyase
MTTLLRNRKTGPLPQLLPDGLDPLSFHRKLPRYAPTPLVSTPEIASRLGLSRVLVKNESSRFGLPSFKLLGASWAIYRALGTRGGLDLESWSTVDDLARALSFLKPFALAAATDGNHGRAVAHMARLLGFECRIFVPLGTAEARIRAIESEGASCTVVDGDYDAAIARSAEEASDRCLVIDDTSWPGYEDIPRWVIQGYGTIFREVEEQIDSPPSVIFVPIGVGALGAAAVDFYKRSNGTRVVGVEPKSAACVLASLSAGKLVTVPGPHESIMAGLNCGTPSSIAFPTLLAGLDAAVAIEDSYAEQAMRTLAACGIVSGETGAAALGGLEALLALPEAPEIRRELGLDGKAGALLLVTEGATDPESYRRIVG